MAACFGDATKKKEDDSSLKMSEDEILNKKLSADLILEEVSASEQLVQQMEEFLPLSYQMVSMVRVALKYQHLPLMHAKLFTPQSALYRYKMVVATNIATAHDLSSMSLFWSKDHLSDGVVCQLLRSLPGLDWKGPIFIRQLPRDLQQTMTAIVSELSANSLVVKWAAPIRLLRVGCSGPTVPCLPEGYYAGPLTKHHGEKVLTGWIDSFGENLKDFSRIIDRLPGVGICKKENSSRQKKIPGTENITMDRTHFHHGDNAQVHDCERSSAKNIPEDITSPKAGNQNLQSQISSKLVSDHTTLDETCQNENDSVLNVSKNETKNSSDELVSWCLLKHGSDIGMTYTTKAHRKLGLARVATLTLVRQILDDQLNAYVTVSEANELSYAMHKKMGFEFYTTDILALYVPKDYDVNHISGAV